MVQEILSFLTARTGTLVDATLGGGGVTEALLEQLKAGLVIGVDLDREAIEHARSRLGKHANVILMQGNFANLDALLAGVPEANNGIDGVVFDLGPSRHQLVSPARGLTYLEDAPLDMRFDQSGNNPTAADIIRSSPEHELARIIRGYGEERFYRRIASRLAATRHRVQTTGDLARVIRSVVPYRFQAKALMRVFMAFRIAVNRELDNLRAGLEQAVRLLNPGGTVVTLAWHSIEDREIKHAFREYAAQGRLVVLTRKPVRPSEEEVNRNPSARSARLRAAMKRS